MGHVREDRLLHGTGPNDALSFLGRKRTLAMASSRFRGTLAFGVHSLMCHSTGTMKVYCRCRPKVAGLNPSGSTDLVLDGFPRCANTYGYFAFRAANGPELNISHHLHGAASFQFAHARGIPALALIRDPRQAVSSLLLRQPMRIKTALCQYSRTYEALLKLPNEAYVLGHFPDVIGDFGSVTRRLNAQFGTTFNHYDKTEESERSIREQVVGADIKDKGRSHARTVAAPVVERTAESRLVGDRLSEYGSELRRAMKVYEGMVERG